GRGLRAKNRKEKEARNMGAPWGEAVAARRQHAGNAFDRHVSTLRLDCRRRHEHRPDDQEHRELVLPVGREMKEVTAADAVSQNEGGYYERDRRDEDNCPIESRDGPVKRTDGARLAS